MGYSINLNQKGNSVLFVLVCIPIALSFLVLVIDISRHQSSRDEAQKFADNLVFQAGKFLPNSEAVDNYVNLQIQQQQDFELISDSPQITADSIVLSLRSRTDSFFDIFLPKDEQNQGKSFGSDITARIRVVPSDVAIIIPDGVSLRPEVNTAFSTVANWPSSNYFNLVSAPAAYPQSGAETVWQNWWEDFSSEDYRRWLTQSCYNPIYSAVKDFAVNIYSTFSSFESSRAFALFYPGDDPLLGYSFPQHLNYWEIDNYISDELCVLMAADDRYSFYPNIEKTCSDYFEFGTAGIFYPRGNFNDCIKNSVSNNEMKVEELIYYHATKNTNPNQLGLFNAIHAALTQVISVGTDLNNGRGNLHSNAKKEIILILNQAFFDLNALIAHWSSIGGDQLNARLTIVPVSLEPDANLMDLYDEINSLNLDWLKSFAPQDEVGLVNDVLPKLSSRVQEVVLSR